MGTTHVQETAVPGVWWITHCSQSGAVLTESIEVTELPDMLRSPPEDILTGAALLQRRLSCQGAG